MGPSSRSFAADAHGCHDLRGHLEKYARVELRGGYFVRELLAERKKGAGW
jgi:hypothetical protein